MPPTSLLQVPRLTVATSTQHSRDFQARITALWPAAELLNFTEAPGEEVKNRFVLSVRFSEP